LTKYYINDIILLTFEIVERSLFGVLNKMRSTFSKAFVILKNIYGVNL